MAERPGRNATPFRDKVRAAETVRKHGASKRDEVNRYKESIPCKDCGIFYPCYVMQFDHTKDDKLFDIGHYLESMSRIKIWQEIDKCEIVCANCHAIRSHNRKQKD